MKICQFSMVLRPWKALSISIQIKDFQITAGTNE